MMSDTGDKHIEDTRNCKNGSLKAGLKMGDFQDHFSREVR